jgi:hypothetical protein
MRTTVQTGPHRSLLRRVLGFAVRCLIVLVVLEGAASLIWLALSLPEALRPPLAERLHTQYDPELGWVNTPSTRIEDFYGPGAGLSINSQGFRSRRDFTRQVPAGRLRVVCSGDSFTLGYGVSDDETWCAQLEALDPRIESVNMGQGGYGVDQAYLWYARDARPFDHQVLLFAFIREDFARMQNEKFLHYGKPILRLEESGLRAHNVPVPRSAYRAPWIVRNAQLVGELRSAQLMLPLVQTLLPERDTYLPMAELAELTGGVFDELDRLNRERGSRLVLIYLPMRRDYASQRDPWRRRVRAEARNRRIPFVDLVDAARRLPTRQFQALFIPDGSVEYLGADGHYNAAGNAWVAEQILTRLEALPQIAGRLAALPPGRPRP